MIRSDACTTDMIKAAATPFPDTSASAMPMRAVAQLDEIVVVAADAAGRNADRGEIGTFGARRGIGQQAALDVRRQGDVAAQRFLFDDPIGQPRVFDHQRELIGARAQHLFLVRAEAGALRPFTQQQHAEDLAACAQRHGQADAGGGERANLVEPVRTVRRGPFGEGVPVRSAQTAAAADRRAAA